MPARPSFTRGHPGGGLVERHLADDGKASELLDGRVVMASVPYDDQTHPAPPSILEGSGLVAHAQDRSRIPAEHDHHGVRVVQPVAGWPGVLEQQASTIDDEVPRGGV